jgi:adenosylmethionine---8-amino-7-oxononanoate aminotransferase
MDKERKKRNSSLERSDKKYIWHPFTQMRDYLKEKPLVIEEGKGVYLKDIDGKRYLDGVSSLWVNVHGHRKKEIDRAIKSQIEKIAHSTMLGLSNVPSIELAGRLVKILPKGLNKVFYSDSGATAVEIGLKMAFQYWQQKSGRYAKKTKFITLKNAYHGDTIGSVSLGGIDLFHTLYKPLLFKTYQAESPYCYRCPLKLSYPDCKIKCLDSLEEIMKKRADEVAALVIEPLVQGAAGIIVQPPGYLKKVWELCREYKILMIADEVATGFGRTGKMFACQHEGVLPDIMALAKGISGGYLPLAATLTTDEIYSGFLAEYEEFKTFFHGHSYTGNPLACAAAIANLDIFKKEKTLQAMQGKISYLKKRLEEYRELKHVGDIRQAGFMVGIELVKEKETKKPYPPKEKVGIKTIMEARKRGLIIRPLGNVIVILPPLAISERELGRMMNIIYDSIKKVTEK